MNAITVNVQVKNANGGDSVGRIPVTVYLLGDANGDSLAAAASGGIAAGADGWLIATVTGRVLEGCTENDGDLDVVITDATARTVYLGVVVDGVLYVSSAVTFA